MTEQTEDRTAAAAAGTEPHPLKVFESQCFLLQMEWN